MTLPTIPEPIKRQVRQEAGFGCCKCGLPIIQYHHIVKDSEDPEDLMLLCPLHHHEATVKAMLEKRQRFHKANPFNIQKGFIEGQLKVNQYIPVINIGSNQFVGDGDFIIVDDESLLSIQINENKLELSMKLYDKEDKLIADIFRNEWISGDPFPWDLEFKFQWLRIRRKLRDIQLEIDARKYPINIRADMWRYGQNFNLTPNALIFNGVKKNIGVNNFCLVALRLEVNIPEKSFSIAPDPRFGKGKLVVRANLRERIQEGIENWKELSRNHALGRL